MKSPAHLSCHQLLPENILASRCRGGVHGRAGFQPVPPKPHPPQSVLAGLGRGAVICNYPSPPATTGQHQTGTHEARQARRGDERRHGDSRD